MRIMLASSMLFAILCTAWADVDLDRELPRSQSLHPLSKTLESLAIKPPADLTPGFPDIVNQAPLGACQSFAMAAWLEYIFYFKTGHVVDLSEKYLAYGLLEYMADEFWDSAKGTYPTEYLGKSILAAKPYLGSGVAPFMLASYFKSQAIPDAIYSFGQMSSSEGAIGLDLDTYNKFFEQDSALYKRDEYLSALPLAFLSTPPSRFVYKLSDSNFSDGSKETITLRAPKDFSDLISLDAKNVVTYYNLDYQGFQMPDFGGDVKDVMSYFNSISSHLGQRSQTVAKSEIMAAIKRSLDHRMAVMIAANVWIGDWLGGVVFRGGGGHAMVVVGYQERNGQTFFKLRNSWGKDRLVQGYNYVESTTLLLNTLYIVIHEP